MPPKEFEPAIPTIEKPQTCACDSAATGVIWTFKERNSCADLQLLLMPVIIIIIIIIIINIKGWAIWPLPSPELWLLSPTFLRSPDCSLASYPSL